VTASVEDVSLGKKWLGARRDERVDARSIELMSASGRPEMAAHVEFV
jgi:hypothetical protein